MLYFFMIMILGEGVFMDNITYSAILSGIVVFISRIIDRAGVVIELNYLSKGKKFMLFISAFFETIVWCLFSSYVLKNASIFDVAGYILGFAVGNTLGIYLLDYLSNDVLSVRIYITRENAFLIKKISDASYGVTCLKVSGKDRDDNLMLIVNTTKKKFNKLTKIIKNNVPNAFVAVYDTKTSVNGLV